MKVKLLKEVRRCYSISFFPLGYSNYNPNPSLVLNTPNDVFGYSFIEEKPEKENLENWKKVATEKLKKTILIMVINKYDYLGSKNKNRRKKSIKIWWT